MTKITAQGFINLLDQYAEAFTTPLDGGFTDGGASGFGAAGAQTSALYLTEAGDASAISYTDIHQGQIGDCFLLSSIGEIARTQPSFISNMIHVNADGSETVRLYEASNGHLPSFGTSSYKQVSETVTNVFPTYAVNNGATQDVVNNVKEIWPQVIEKAVAQLAGGYGAIAGGGNPVIAMEELTGHMASAYSANRVTVAQLQSYVAAGDMVTMDTATANSTYNLVGGHAYMLTGLTTLNGAPAAVLSNPWGFNQPTSAIPVSQLGRAFVEVDVGHV